MIKIFGKSVSGRENRCKGPELGNCSWIYLRNTKEAQRAGAQ